ncbi:MAG: SDR family NAD(P)-dependent oxidoreductase [Saprospiraceae bacterium]|nr:SDR family NAD(P)-dependent oxidoreductase [Saprospiraceae bacterium]
MITNMDQDNTVTTSTFFGVERKEVYLNYLPTPDSIAYKPSKNTVTLLTNEGTDFTPKLAMSLSKKGHRVVILSLMKSISHSNSYNDIDIIKLEQNDDEHIQKAIFSIQSKYGKIGHFIHLHPAFKFQNGRFTQHFNTEKEIIQTVFLLAKHLQANLNELGQTERTSFLTVTQLDGKLGLAKQGDVSILGGGLNGLTKCLNLEWSPVYCRAVDIAPTFDSDQKAASILQELYDPNRSVLEVGLHQEGRTTLAAKEVALQENSPIKTTITKDSVFLVSGGAKGITAKCVIEMAKTFQCKFILLGRSKNDFILPTYAQNGISEAALKAQIMNALKAKGEKPSLSKVKSIYKNIVAKKEIDQTLNSIQTYGAEAVYLQADVTQLHAIHPQLNAITQKWGKITGIIHGAGRLADKYIQDKTAQDFHNVLSVKLDGLLNLLQVVDIHNLDHLVLFSSVAGFYGNVGQTDYAIANEILNKAAQLFKTNHPNTQVSSINWGAWDSGMVSDALKKKFEAMGVRLVNTDGGPALLVNEMNVDYANQAQVILGGTLPTGISYTEGELKTHKIHRNLNLEENPFLMHHVIQNHAVLPVVNAMGWMCNNAEQIFPDFKIYKVENTQLFKGLVFDGNQPKHFVTELKEVQKSAEEIVLETTIYSKKTQAKLPTYHYKAQITLVKKNKVFNTSAFQANLIGKQNPVNGTAFYQDGSLFHDEYFRGIEQVHYWDQHEMLMTCTAPEVPSQAQGQFPVDSVNTFFSDIQYQGMVVWVQKYYEGAKSLPLATESCTIYEKIPFGKSLNVHIQIVEHNSHKMVATCTVYDETGKVYMLTKNAALTVSKDLKW